jgi:hypothetical protein
MCAYVDLKRIREVQGVMGTDARAIVASMLASMTAAIEEVEAALAQGALDRATGPAHACRNDALMLGARQLLDTLNDLEAATRAFDAGAANDALDRLREVWPPTRQQLADIARATEPP